MWFDCGNVFLNLTNVDYLSFEKSERGCKATVYFASGESLNFEHTDIEVLKNHFRKIFEAKNESSNCGSKTEQMG